MSNLANTAKIYTVNDLVRTYENETHGHFFSKDTMRFFKSKISDVIHFGKVTVFFVTSEKGPDMIRKYSVRGYNTITKSIDTVGSFQAFKTSSAAHRFAKNQAENELATC